MPRYRQRYYRFLLDVGLLLLSLFTAGCQDRNNSISKEQAIDIAIQHKKQYTEGTPVVLIVTAKNISGSWTCSVEVNQKLFQKKTISDKKHTIHLGKKLPIGPFEVVIQASEHEDPKRTTSQKVSFRITQKASPSNNQSEQPQPGTEQNPSESEQSHTESHQSRSESESPHSESEQSGSELEPPDPTQEPFKGINELSHDEKRKIIRTILLERDEEKLKKLLDVVEFDFDLEDNVTDWGQGRKAIHFAVEIGSYPAFKLLQEKMKKVDPHEQVRGGLTLILFAAFSKEDTKRYGPYNEKHVTMIFRELLEETNLSTPQMEPSNHSLKFSIFSYAISADRKENIDLVFDKIPIDKKLKKEFNEYISSFHPVYSACMNNNLSALKKLVSAGVNLNLEVYTSQKEYILEPNILPVIFLSPQGNVKEFLQFVLSKMSRSAINRKNPEGQTALEIIPERFPHVPAELIEMIREKGKKPWYRPIF